MQSLQNGWKSPGKIMAHFCTAVSIWKAIQHVAISRQQAVGTTCKSPFVARLCQLNQHGIQRWLLYLLPHRLYCNGLLSHKHCSDLCATGRRCNTANTDGNPDWEKPITTSSLNNKHNSTVVFPLYVHTRGGRIHTSLMEITRGGFSQDRHIELLKRLKQHGVCMFK